jgi:hypothetical protein
MKRECIPVKEESMGSHLSSGLNSDRLLSFVVTLEEARTSMSGRNTSESPSEWGVEIMVV